MLEQKFGGKARVDGMLEHVRGLARGVGITFDVDRQRACNTGLAHRAIAVARAYGAEDVAVDGFFRAYFEEGKDLAQQDVVLDVLAAAVGVVDPAVDREALRQELSQPAVAAAVEADKKEARRINVQGVPFFVLDERLAVSGAPEPSTFVAFLREGRRASVAP